MLPEHAHCHFSSRLPLRREQLSSRARVALLTNAQTHEATSLASEVVPGESRQHISKFRL